MGNTGSGKVVHLNDATHAKVRALAKAWGLSMRECIEKIITDGTAGNVLVLPAKTQDAVPVSVREKSKPVKWRDTEQIIQGPPFWAGREKKES